MAFDVATQRVFKLNETGARLLEGLKSGRNPDEVKKELGLDDEAFNTFMNTLGELDL